MVEKYQQSLTMEFRETLLAAQRNQQQQSSRNQYYKAKFDPPKKEQKQKDKLSANIQKFLAKKDEEERQKKLEAQRKREELLAMRDPKALRKIQKTLKVIKSANKSVLEDAVDRDNTAVTLTGPEQPDQDDYGYESQEAAALYAKMMQKYSKIPDEPKFPTSNSTVKKDLNGTRERVKHALQHEDEPVPHRRRRKTADTTGKDSPTRYEPEVERKSETSKPEKPKIRKSMPPPIDFNQLLKLAEQKKSEPLDVATKKMVAEKEPERPMTKKQRKEYEEELARRQRRQERLESEKGGAKKVSKEERPIEKERKLEQAGIARIPKLSDRDKNMNNVKNNTPKAVDKDRIKREQDRVKHEKERARLEKEKIERERIDNEQIEKLKAEREKIERDIDRLNRDRERLEKSRSKLETSLQSNKSFDKSERNKILPKEHSGKPEIKKNIDLKSQNTYRIDKNFIEKKPAHLTKPGNGKYPNDLQKKNGYKDNELSSKQKLPTVNGHNKLNLAKKSDASNAPSKLQAGPSKAITSTFDFDKHINSIGKNNRQDARKFPADVRRKAQQDDRKKPKRRLDSDSEYDSEMDDFIDDGDENMDYSKHIKEIFGYDKSKYRHMDDDDDPMMESSFARQQREEYISKKIGIMEDLEDMRMEAMEKKKSKKKRRISDDD